MMTRLNNEIDINNQIALQEMELNDSFNYIEGEIMIVTVTRVVNGWIYSYYASKGVCSTFVEE